MSKSRNKPVWIEIHQLDWIPSFLKERQLEGIFPILKAIRFDQKLLFLFNRLRDKTQALEFVDLGSGGGNVVEFISQRVNGELRFIMSDISPKLELYQKIKQRNRGRINFVPYSVDLCEADGILNGRAVTIITTFHELDRPRARNFMKSLAKWSRGFLIAEPINISFKQILRMPLLFFYFWLAPFYARPFRVSCFFFTWVWPILPFFHLHDGLVSLARSYRKNEFEQMLKKYAGPDWEWETGNLDSSLTYVLAWRKSES